MSKRDVYDELKSAGSVVNKAVAEIGVAIADDMESPEVTVVWIDEAIEHLEAAKEELQTDD